MKITRRLGIIAIFMAMFLAAAGCSDEDGGVTDPLPDVTPKGDLVVKPDTLGVGGISTMDPLIQAVAQAQPGFVIVVFPGVYDGNLVIDKPLHFVSSAGKENTVLTNSADAAAVSIEIDESFGPADSLIFEGLGFNDSGTGVLVNTATVPVAARKCDFLDNAGNGLVLGRTLEKAAGDGKLVLWQCFFRRNGLNVPDGGPEVLSAALWWTGTLIAESIFFESNGIDIALTDAARGLVSRMTSDMSVLSSIWLESGSDLMLDGVDEDVPTQLRSGSGWAAVVDASRLHLRDFTVSHFSMGGFQTNGSVLILDNVLLDSNFRYGIFSVDSTDSLMNTTITGTVTSTEGELGYGMAASSTGNPVVSYLGQCLIQGSFRGGIMASGAVNLELKECEVVENGVRWGELYDPTAENTEDIIGGGLGLFDGANATVDALTTIKLNVALIGGGVAIMDPSTSASFNATTIDGNSAVVLGGGVAIFAGSATVNDGSIMNNACKYSGGGIAVVEGGSVASSGATKIGGNSADLHGGGVLIIEGHGGFTGGTKFMGNSAANDLKNGLGGGIYFSEADLVLESAAFSGNMSDAGAALYAINLKNDVDISDCEFRLNISGNAAVYVRDLTRELRMTRCLIVQNKLNSPTGMASTAVFSQQDLPGGTLSLVGCTIADNQGGLGAIDHHSGNMEISESVLAFNRPGALVGTDLDFVIMDCNDFWDNGDFDYGLGADPGPNSFAADPLFCDMENGVFTVDGESKLLPGNNSCNVLIGALGQGCGQGF